MSEANASPTRSASPIGRSFRRGRSRQRMSEANASPMRSASAIARSFRRWHSHLRMIAFILGIYALVLSPLGFSQAQPPAPKAPEEPPSPLSVPKEYHYNGRGRRDPFVNPVPKPAVPVQSAAARPPQCPQSQGLKGVLVGQAAIAGVVTSREPSMNVAIISAPGGKTYFARVGDALCDAVLKGIKLDVVTFMPTVTSGIDQRGVREIERKVRPTPGEPK